MPQIPAFHFKDQLTQIARQDVSILTTGNLHGLERECLRVDTGGKLASTPHPPLLGSPLTHPYITTDFSEAQIEFTTRPHTSIDEVITELDQLQRFVCKRINGEVLWPFSMPAILPESQDDIPLARYGCSRQGLYKTTYRRGLGHRYGRRMQTISGIHYNFSFGETLLKYLEEFGQSDHANRLHGQEFRTAVYMHVIRNLRRCSLLIPYLFGASPTVHESFFDHPDQVDNRLSSDHHAGYFAEYATSLRLSGIGYTNQLQRTLPIGYNSFADYLNGMRHALSTPHAPYQNWSPEQDEQLNTNILQIENEHYAIVRPKPDPALKARPVDALEQEGIHYLEVRGLDLNPFSPIGVEATRIYFMHMVLLDCLLEDSPPESSLEIEHRRNDFDQLVWSGREINFCMQEVGDLKTAARNLCLRLESLADILDSRHSTNPYQAAVNHLESICEDPANAPSAKTLQCTRDHGGFIAAGLQLAADHCTTMDDHFLSPDVLEHLEETTRISLQKQAAIESAELTGQPGVGG